MNEEEKNPSPELLQMSAESKRIQKRDQLRSDLQIGLEQIKAGKGRELDDALIEEIKKRGRERIRGSEGRMFLPNEAL